MNPLKSAVLAACSALLLAGCGSILYLPSDAVNEDVTVDTGADLLKQITISADYCDDVTLQGTLINNSTSDASVTVTMGLDDGTGPKEQTGTVSVKAGSSTPFEWTNESGINPILGCSATVSAADIVGAG